MKTIIIAIVLLSAVTANAQVFGFNDVPKDHWAYAHIRNLSVAGIVAGCSATPPEFCPEDLITRAEAAVMVNAAITDYSRRQTQWTQMYIMGILYALGLPDLGICPKEDGSLWLCE